MGSVMRGSANVCKGVLLTVKGLRASGRFRRFRV